VREKADIFILIVGKRYGHQTGNGKSITNLEYLEAKKKGIPVYVFVNSDVMSILPLWKNNPYADFSTHVENGTDQTGGIRVPIDTLLQQLRKAELFLYFTILVF
jgi:hypothetical protein